MAVKFLNLLKKELREMLTLQTILILVVIFIAMSSLGNLIKDSVSDASKESSRIVICDQDKTSFTESLIEFIKNPVEDIETDVTVVELESDNYPEELKRLEKESIVVIPKGFTESVNNFETAELKSYTKMTSLSVSKVSVGSTMTQTLVESAIKSALYTDKVSKGQMTEDEVKQFSNPLSVDEYTVVDDKMSNISSTIIYSAKAMENSMFPIVVFMLIMYSSQMILNAISTEKIDKTLETLLSAPVSRMSVLISKMLASSIVAALYAITIMISEKNIIGNAVPTDSFGDISSNLKELGLTISTNDYIFIGLQMFVSILIALAIAMVLGVIAKDAKSGQSLMLPLQMLSLVPYFVSMFTDVNSLTPVFRYLLYAIPFTHTFMASSNLMFGNMTVYWGGLIYQIIFLIICMTFAIRVFTSDKIFTMSISLGKKNKYSKSAEN